MTAPAAPANARLEAAVPQQYRQFLQLSGDVRGNGTPDVSTGAVLLTGVTGFLGAALLDELMRRRPDRTVYCLVRAPEGEHEQRLRSTVGAMDLWDDAWEGKVKAIAGDLSRPGAGLTPEDAALLRDDVSQIYHSGAFVNLAFPFEQIQAANVGGTVEMLRLAVTGRPKRMCHVSTLSTIDINARTGEVLEDPAPLGAWEAMTTGYTKSKWVAERLVEQAAERDVDVRTLRLGALAGHSRTGVSNPNDYAWLVVSACLEIGAVPLMRAPTSWLPVDLVAQASVMLTELPAPEYLPYQVLPAGQITYADIFSWLRRAGYHLPAMPFPQWRELLRTKAEGGSRTVQAIASVIPKAGLPGEAQADLHSPRTEQILAEHSASPPKLTEETFRVLLAAGTRRGELPAPPRTGGK